jgi:hypothetical protein
MVMAMFLNLLLFPRHHATGLPFEYLRLLKQAIIIFIFLSVCLGRALVGIISSNTWRTFSRRPLPEPTEYQRTSSLASELSSSDLTLWRSPVSPPCRHLRVPYAARFAL